MEISTVPHVLPCCVQYVRSIMMMTKSCLLLCSVFTSLFSFNSQASVSSLLYIFKAMDKFFQSSLDKRLLKHMCCYHSDSSFKSIPLSASFILFLRLLDTQGRDKILILHRYNLLREQMPSFKLF